MNLPLLIAAASSAIASLLHIGCITFGASWYRFFGAGEEMAVLAEQGSISPTIITSLIAAVLAVWSFYGLSGAGLIFKLPLLRFALIAITSVYLLRGVAGLFFIFNPIGRTPEFWLWSSAICLTIGVIHFIGVKQVWSSLA